MTTTTQINITAKDQTSGAFASANNNLAGLASSALKTTAGLAGIGLSIAGAVEAVKGISQATIQFQKFNSTLLVGTGSAQGAADALSFVRAESQRLGLDLATAAEQFGKLTAASKGSALEGKATRDIFSSMSEAAAVLGLSADETRGALNAFQQMISKGKVQAEELRGQLGERLPGAFQLAARAMGVTTAELDKLLVAGKVTAEDLLPKLAIELNKTFGAQAEKSAQGLAGQMNRMNTAIFDLKIAIGESGLINFLSSGIELATKLANALTSAFGGGQKLSPIEKQVSLIQTLEKELESLNNLTHIPLIGDLLFDKKQADLLKSRIEFATEDLAKLKASLASEKGETVIGQATKDTEKLSVVTKKTISDAERFLSALKKEAQNAGLTAVEMKRLEAANLGVSKTADPLISRIEQVTKEMEDQKAAASSLASDLNKIKSITESVKTEEEKLVDTQAELNRLLGSGLPIETYNRAMQKAQNETKGLERQTIDTTDAVSQLWVQAGRNIQSTLANSIFNFFDDGLKGMLKNVISTVGRIASEFAALKVAQGVGLAGLFGASGAANASTSALSLAGIGSGAANLGSSALNLFKVGGGISQGVSGLLGIGSSGTQAAAEAGATALWGTSGASASIGSSIASFAGPAIAVAAVDQIVRMLVGDKTLGGTAGKVLNFVPVLGPLINGLFGRGPIKQQGTLLEGQIGAEGFESGFLQTRFKAKGGAFRSDKIDFSRVDAVTGETFTDNGKLTGFTAELAEAGKQIFDSVNEATKQTTTALRGVASTLGLATGGIDNFNYSLSILTEKGEMIQGEQIAEEISKISEGLALSLMPSIQDFQRSNETAVEALVRLNTEFISLDQAVQNLGATSGYANSLIKSLSIQQRTQLVEMAGGVENLGSITSFFFSNFLTSGEQLALKTDQLNSALVKLGVSTSLAVEDYKKLIQSESTANDLRIALLQLAPAFLEIRNAESQLIGTTDTLIGTTDTLAKSERTLADIRSELLGKYNQERGELEATISKFKGISDKLRDFRQSLAFGELSPLTPAQKLDQARANFNQTRLSAASGDESALDKLPTVAQEFLRASQTYNASSAAFISDFNLVSSVLENSEKTALSQSDVARSQLAELQSSVEYLLNIDNTTKTTNDLLKELIAATLSGSGNQSISTGDIQGFLAANPGLSPAGVAAAATKFGVSNTQLSAAGYDVSLINKSQGGASVTDSQIAEFVNANRNNPMAIYNAAVANGVSSSRLSKASGIALTDIQKFVRDNGLPSFAKGTDFIQRSGLAMVHRAEAIVPSSTTDEIKKLREELAALRAEQNQQTGDMIKVISITNKQNAEIIAKSNKEVSKDNQWGDRSKAALA